MSSQPPAPVEAVDYNSVDELLASTDHGALAPLSGNYLVGLAKGNGPLVRRQDLPKEAFLVPSEAALRRAQTSKVGDRRNKIFVALSYRWLEADHPDRSAYHLRIVAFFIQKYLDYRKAHGIDDVAMFWDWGSLHQKPRVGREQSLFNAGLRSSNIWYGSTQSTVWLQPYLPSWFSGNTYEKSGWCFVEATISSAIKKYDCRLNLGGLAIDGDGNVLESDDFLPLELKCMAKRLAPKSPTKVKDLLAHEKVFTSKSDVDVVGELYQNFFEAVTSTTEKLEFTNVSWSAEHMRDFVEVLPFFTKLRELDLRCNYLGSDGATILSSSLKANCTITTLRIDKNEIGDEGAKALAESLKVNETITMISLQANKIGDAGAVALAESQKANGKVEVHL